MTTVLDHNPADRFQVIGFTFGVHEGLVTLTVRLEGAIEPPKLFFSLPPPGDLLVGANEADGAALVALALEIDVPVRGDPVHRTVGPNHAELAVISASILSDQSSA